MGMGTIVNKIKTPLTYVCVYIYIEMEKADEICMMINGNNFSLRFPYCSLLD